MTLSAASHNLRKPSRPPVTMTGGSLMVLKDAQHETPACMLEIFFSISTDAVVAFEGSAVARTLKKVRESSEEMAAKK